MEYWVLGKWLISYSRKLFIKRLLRLSVSMVLNVLLALLPPASSTLADKVAAKSKSDSVAPSPLAKKIVSIRPETGDHGLRVHIIADGKLEDYESFRLLSPHRLVIDLPNVQCSLKKKTLFVDSLLVEKIQLSTSNKDKVRIIFDLFPIAGLPYKIFPQGNQLIVAVGSVAGSPVVTYTEKTRQTPPVNIPEKKQEVAGGQKEKTALSPGRKITAVELETDNQGTKVHIVADGNLTRYDTFHLSDPARLVVDLFGVQSAVGKETLLFSNPLVKGVRLGTSYKDQVRIVFDLGPPEGLSYKIVPKNGRLVIFLEQASKSSPTVPAGKVQSAPPSGTTKQAATIPVPAGSAREKPFTELPPGKTILHVSSFKHRDNAENEVQRLEKHGHKTFLTAEIILGGAWLRVYIGNFKDGREARNTGSDLKKRGIISYFKPRTI